MNKLHCNSIVQSYRLLGTLVLTTVFAGLVTAPKMLAEGGETSPGSCNSRNPYNLKADTQSKFQVQLSWDTCDKYKNDFYQVGWNLTGGSDQIVTINDTNARSWTLTRARDESKYTFKVRGCNNRSSQEPDCTPWSSVTATTPDWD